MSGATAAEENAARAVAAYAAMQRHFVPDRDRSGLYQLTSPWTGGNKYAYVWEFSRALVGTLAMAGMPAELARGVDYATEVEARFKALEHYWSPWWSRWTRPAAYDSYVVEQGGGDQYHDDNAWIALAFIQRYRMGLSTSLERARQLFKFGQSGWDRDAGHPAPGGVFWVRQGTGMGLSNHDRGAGCTAGNASLGYQLAQLSGASEFVAVANDMLDWVLQHLVADGLCRNAVRIDGSIDTNLWSYNQGVVIGALVLRYSLDQAAEWLELATRCCERTLGAFGDFRRQPVSFNAMLFQNLLMLYPHVDALLQRRMLDAMQEYADWVWSQRSSETLFLFEGEQAQVQDQGAVTQLFALLAWPEGRYAALT